MAEPKVGTIRTNPTTGRLERLVGSKAKGTLRWRTADQARQDDLAILQRTKQNIDAVGRRVGETKVKDGVLQRFTKEGTWVPADESWHQSDSSLGLNSKDYLKISAAPLRFDRPVDPYPTSKTGVFGHEANPFYKAPESLGSNFRNPADLGVFDTSQIPENASQQEILQKTIAAPKPEQTNRNRLRPRTDADFSSLTGPDIKRLEQSGGMMYQRGGLAHKLRLAKLKLKPETGGDG